MSKRLRSSKYLVDSLTGLGVATGHQATGRFSLQRHSANLLEFWSSCWSVLEAATNESHAHWTPMHPKSREQDAVPQFSGAEKPRSADLAHTTCSKEKNQKTLMNWWIKDAAAKTSSWTTGGKNHNLIAKCDCLWPAVFQPNGKSKTRA